MTESSNLSVSSTQPAGTIGSVLEPETVTSEPLPQIAQVRVVVPLTDLEADRLSVYLERVAGRSVELQVRIDRSILGGVWVRMDDLVIDGSIRARLEALRERLCANCSFPEGAGPAHHRNQA
jgi:hypothetical protein